MLHRHMQLKMPKHIVNLLVLLACFLLVSIAAKIFLTDPSFYRFGTYRADAVPELAIGEPLFRGAANCQTCHSERYSTWSNGSHGKVQCEVCHGPDRDHPDNGKTLIAADSIRLCTVCHLAMPARPAAQSQIVLAEHPSPGEAMQQCHTCHDPHSPGDTEADPPAPGDELTTQRPEVIRKCAKCHGKQGEGKRKNPALAGTESAVFVERMQVYKIDDSKSKAMSKYANSLSDEEISDLANYYENLASEPLP
jgi:cytochrome c553